MSVPVRSVELINEDMKTEHTPGPWKVVNHTPGLFEIFGPDPQMSALVVLDERFDHSKEWREKTTPANAKLIAAAPELLENLIRLIDRMEENDMGNMSAVTRAKDAITKATL